MLKTHQKIVMVIYRGNFIKYKPIEQLDINYNVIQIWDSQCEISRNLNFDQGTISKAIKNKNKAYGFFWRKKNDDE